MGRRRRRRRRRRLRRLEALLVVGAGLPLAALFLPWIAVEPDLPVPLVGPLLSTLGAIPSEEQIAGYEIPLLLREAGGDVAVQTSLALTELLSGRLDRAAARALFGDRYEEELAPLVFVPSLVGLLNLVLLRWPRTLRLPTLLLVADLATLLATGWAMLRIPGSSSVLELTLLPGLPVTLAGFALLVVVTALWPACRPPPSMATPPPTRRRRRRKPAHR